MSSPNGEHIEHLAKLMGDNVDGAEATIHAAPNAAHLAHLNTLLESEEIRAN